MIDLSKVRNIKLAGMNSDDAPVHTYLYSAKVEENGILRELTETELEYINIYHYSWVLEKLLNSLDYDLTPE